MFIRMVSHFLPELISPDGCPQAHWRTWRSCTSMTTPTCTAFPSSWPSAASCPSWALRTVPSATCRPRLWQGDPPSSSSFLRCRDRTVPWCELGAAQSQSSPTPDPPRALQLTPRRPPQLHVSNPVNWHNQCESRMEGKAFLSSFWGQNLNISVETPAQLAPGFYHLIWGPPAARGSSFIPNHSRGKDFDLFCQNWWYIKFYILSNCEPRGESFNHINHAPIANVFTVITSIYYLSKNTIVCKKKITKKVFGTSRLLLLPYFVILWYYSFIIPFFVSPSAG